MRAAGGDWRLSAPSLLTRAQVTTGLVVTFQGSGASWTTAPDGSAITTWTVAGVTSNPVSAVKPSTLTGVPPRGMPITLMGWFTGPAHANAMLSVQWKDATGVILAAQYQPSPDALSETPQMWRFVFPPSNTAWALLTLSWYGSNVANGDVISVQRIGAFLGDVPAAFWRLPTS